MPGRRPSQKNQCPFCQEFKNSYATKSDAQANAEWVLNTQGAAVKVYKCPNSECWHLSSSTGPRPKPKRKRT